jgi:hypothetical protein
LRSFKLCLTRETTFSEQGNEGKFGLPVASRADACVSKATRANNRREEKRCAGLGRRAGVRAVQRKRHEVLNRVGETNFAQELSKADEAPEWGDAPAPQRSSLTESWENGNVLE